jgi:serine/threonine protein kinase
VDGTAQVEPEPQPKLGDDEAELERTGSREMWRFMESEPEPEPEPELELDRTDGTAMVPGPARLQVASQLARRAVEALRQWEESLDCNSAWLQSDADIDELEAAIDEAQHGWPSGDANVRHTVETLCHRMEMCVGSVTESVRAERAVREIYPEDTLRAVLWGLGDQFPQLPARTLKDTIDRYVSARIDPRSLRDSGGHQRQLDELVRLGSVDANGLRRDEFAARAAHRLRTMMHAAEQPHQPLVAQGLFVVCLGIRSQLMDEKQLLLDLRVRARDGKVDQKMKLCSPFVDATTPTADELMRLRIACDELRIKLGSANHKVREVKMKIQMREDHIKMKFNRPSSTPSEDLGEELQLAQEKQKVEQALWREANSAVKAEIARLTQLALHHFPELYVRVPALLDVGSYDAGDATLFLDSFELGKELRASDGRTHVCHAVLDGQKYVLKGFETGKPSKVRRELKLLERLQHSNVVPKIAHFFDQDSGRHYMQMPRYPQDLRQLLQAATPLSGEKRRKILLGLLRAVRVVHAEHYTHNDIKPDNIFVKSDGTAVLGDFELCCHSQSREDIDEYLVTETTTTTPSDMLGVGGTAGFKAPEREQGATPTLASDIYSCGVVILATFEPALVFNRAPPWPEATQQVFEQAKDCGEIAIVQDTVSRMLALEPSERPTARFMLEDADADPYFARAESNLPEYWDLASRGTGFEAEHEAGVIEITDDRELAGLRTAIGTTRPDELGLGADASAALWSSVSRDAMGRDIQIVKAWRVQNPQVRKKYAMAKAGVEDEVSRGPPIDCDMARDRGGQEMSVVNREKLRLRGWVPEGATHPSDGDVGADEGEVVQVGSEPADFLKARKAAGGSSGGDRVSTLRTTMLASGKVLPQGCAGLERAAQHGCRPDRADAANLDVNETYLMHGLRPKTVNEIVFGEGFNPRLAGRSAGALFGEGTYFAEDIEKADQYTGHPDTAYDTTNSEGMQQLHKLLYKQPADHPGDVCYLLVCRVVLGYVVRTQGRVHDSEYGWQRNCVAMDGAQASAHVDARGRHLVFECSEEERKSGRLQTCKELVHLPWQNATGAAIRYHSLLAELGDDAMLAGGLHHLQRFREFVVYRGDLVYPEYIVAVSEAGCLPSASLVLVIVVEMAFHFLMCLYVCLTSTDA